MMSMIGMMARIQPLWCLAGLGDKKGERLGRKGLQRNNVARLLEKQPALAGLARLLRLPIRIVAEEGHLALHYRGGDADAGQIDYYTAATAMLAFGDLMGKIANVEYGDRTGVETKIRAISPTGSISFEFVIISVGLAQLALTESPSVWALLEKTIDTFKFLKGKPPVDISPVNDGTDNLVVTNISGETHTIHQNVTIIAMDSTAGEAVERLIKRPMDAAGITSVEIENEDTDQRIDLDRSEGYCFTDVSIDKDVLVSTAERALYIESAIFREGNKWSFFDGQNRFGAAIEDDSFLARINHGEPFAKGDMLVADVRSTQKFRRGKLVVDHVVIRVKDHITRASTLRITGRTDQD